MQITLQRSNCLKLYQISFSAVSLFKSPHNQLSKWRNLQIVSKECNFVEKWFMLTCLVWEWERISLKRIIETLSAIEINAWIQFESWMWMRHNPQLPSEDFTSKSSRRGSKSSPNGSSDLSDRSVSLVMSSAVAAMTTLPLWTTKAQTFECVKFSFIFTTIQMNNSWNIFVSPNWDFSFRARIKMTACCAHATAVVCSMVCKDLFICLSKQNVMSGARVNSCLPKLFERCIARNRACLPEHVMTRDEA